MHSQLIINNCHIILSHFAGTSGMINGCCRWSGPIKNGVIIIAANASTGRIFFSNQILQWSKITYFSGNFYTSHQSINICFGGQIIWMDSWVIIWRGGSQGDPTCAFRAELQNRCGKRWKFMAALGWIVRTEWLNMELNVWTLQFIASFQKPSSKPGCHSQRPRPS